ncbi:MAG: hypothetical protein ACRC7U_06015 [Moraxella sp.]
MKTSTHPSRHLAIASVITLAATLISVSSFACSTHKHRHSANPNTPSIIKAAKPAK